MPREINPSLQALIDSGHCNQHSTIDLELKGEPDPLLLSSGELLIGVKQYKAVLKDVEEFSTSVDAEVDNVEFDAQNVDFIIGHTLTGFDNPLAGAEGILGIIFINRLTAAMYYDAKMRGELVTGEVGDTAVEFQIIADPDIAFISGRTIAGEFKWREPIHVNPIGNPNDIGSPGRGGGHSGPGPDLEPGRSMPGGPGGRYGDISNLMPVITML